MTDDKIALRALLEKGSDATFLREMIGFAAERLMALETEPLCGDATTTGAVCRAGGRKSRASCVNAVVENCMNAS